MLALSRHLYKLFGSLHHKLLCSRMYHACRKLYILKRLWRPCRDIKLENTLLESVESGRNPLIKICDFGYSIDDQSSLPKTKVGTPGYTGVSIPIWWLTEKFLGLYIPAASV